MQREILASEYNFAEFKKRTDVPRGQKGNRKFQKKKISYKDYVCAFDIETTRIPQTDDTVMYIWQFCLLEDLENSVTVYGRTWSEFKDFIHTLNKFMSEDERLLIFIHNASYEFQFLRGIFEFDAEDVFCIKSRKILKFNIGKCEFRCSYLQTNMNLRSFLKKMGARHQKTELEYSGERYWYTELNETELRYCLNDVTGLCEAMYIQMQRDGDNLYTLPLTSTGYVRRDAKEAMQKMPKGYIYNIAPDYATYKELREAFRGGDTHANRYYSNVLLTLKRNGLIHSADRSSSYPAVQCNNEYPISHFYDLKDPTFKKVMDLIEVRGRAVLARVKITGLELADNSFGCPYLSKSKCRNVVEAELDNGRILSAEYLETTLTDIDLAIILKEYKFGTIEFYDVKHARYGRLPQCLIDVTLDYYRKKTELKNVSGQEYFYMKSKNKLNSVYGMCAQDPLKENIVFEDEDYKPKLFDDPEEEMELHNKRAFLSYSWAPWVTAWARYRLHEGIWLVHKTKGAAFLYCDTDSIKYIGDVDFSKYNKERIAESKKSGSYATDPQGNVHYMGVFEQEEDMIAFKTLGAKKYCYIDTEGVLHLTVAGVGKSAGVKELEKNGGIQAFNVGFIFREAGGLEAKYNDMKCGECKYVMSPDGEEHRVTSNVTLKESTYTLSLAQDYSDLLEGIERISLDF